MEVKDALTGIMDKISKAIIYKLFSGISVPSGQSTELSNITLPANGIYLLLGFAGCGALTGTFAGNYYALNTLTKSGTPSFAYHSSIKVINQAGGGGCLATLVKTGSSDVTIGLNMYLYGTNAATNGNGFLIALPVIGGGTA